MARKGISRRQFIESSVAGVAASRMTGLRAHGGETSGRNFSGDEAGAGERITVSLNAGWRFKRQGTPGAGIEPEFVGAERVGYNDSGWEAVVVPHTWDASPDNPFAAPGHFRGVGWYRRGLEVPQGWRGRRVLIHFNGAFQITDVWVSGRHVGQHVGGYTSFAFDVTHAVELGKTNVVTVKVMTFCLLSLRRPRKGTLPIMEESTVQSGWKCWTLYTFATTELG